MERKEEQPVSVLNNLVLDNDDSESPCLNQDISKSPAKRDKRDPSSSEATTETLAEQQTESDAALSTQKVSESEQALKNLQSKLKEVETNPNLNTPVRPIPDESEADGRSESLDQTVDGPEKLTNEAIVSETSNNALKLDIDSARKNTSEGKINTENDKTRQKQVTEAWNSVGLQRCRFCKFMIDDNELFKQHTTTCTPKVSVIFSGGVYTCETCDITWTSKPEFEEHIVCHTTDEPYVCIKCKKVFKSRLLTEQHAKTDHPSGGSIYGLRGMKKSRKIVEELEGLGKYQFRGKIEIPPTPRNKQISGSNDAAVSNEKPPELSVEGISLTATKGNTSDRSEDADNTTFSSSIWNEVNDFNNQVQKNTEQIEKNMKELRQYIISSRSAAATTDSTAQSKGKPSVKTKVVKENDSNASNPLSPSVLKNDQNSGNKPGVTIHYQPNQKQTNVVVTEPSDAVSTNLLPPVSQPINNASLNTTTNVFNISGPPNASATRAQSFTYNPGSQTLVHQPERRYQFTEYVHPPPPRPRIPVASVAPSPVVQTTVQPSSTHLAPTPIQANTTPIILIPIPPVFNNPATPVPNVLIPFPNQPGQNTAGYPLAPLGSQSSQKLVQNVRYPIQSSGQSDSTIIIQPAVSNQSGQHLSLVTAVSTSNTSVLVNSLISSKPQLVLTTNSFASQPSIPLGTQTSQSQNIPQISSQKSAILQSLASKIKGNISSLVSSSSVGPSVHTVSSLPTLKTAASTSFISSTSKQPIPTVEISVLPENPQSQSPYLSKNIDSKTQKGAQCNLSKRYLFRIKTGHGFVCEACRKYTQDEVIFRRHVWDHFHTVTRSCKFCTADKVQKKEFMSCSLVSSVVCSLVKKSTNPSKAVTEEAAPEKTISVVDDEVIAISDEEGESKNTDSFAVEKNDVIVVDEEEEVPSKFEPVIKISSTYSLSGRNKQEALKTNVTEEDTSLCKSKNDIDETEGPHELDTVKGSSNNLDIETKSSDAVSKSSTGKEHSDSSKNENNKSPDYSLTKEKQIVKDQDKIDKTEDQSTKTHTITASENSSLESALGTSFTADIRDIELQASETLNHRTLKRSHASKDANFKFERHVLSSQKSSSFYMCGFDQCSFTSLISQKYKEHLSANHTGAYSYICCHCGLKHYTEDAHIRHVNSHANVKVFLLFNCPASSCKYKTNLIHMFRNHLTSHKETSMKCTYCHKNFESMEILTEHLKANLIKFVSCQHCHFKFKFKDVVAKHIKLAHPDKPRIVTVSSQIVCMERELNFYNPPLAKSVTGEQRNQERIGLPGLSIELEANTSPDESGGNISGSPVTVIDDPDNESSSPPPPILTSEISSGQNKEKISNEIDMINSEAPRSLMCTKCNFISWNYKLHLQHLSLHETDEPEREKRFVCMYCPKGFDGLNPFKTHVSNHVGKHKIKIYYCTLCVFTTSQRYHMMDHCKDNHLGTGTYFQKTDMVVSKEASCKHCNFKSRQAEQVHLHEKIVHQNPSQKQTTNNDSPKQSSEPSTSAKLSDETSLNAESRDSNQKFQKYHCHYCMNYFKHKADLRVHMKTSHLDIESKSFVTFKCKYCSFTSTIKNLIINHIERKHLDEPVRILRRIENIDTAEGSADAEDKGTEKQMDKTIYRCDICELSMESSETFKKHFADKHANYDSDDKETEIGQSKEKEIVYIPDGNTFKEPVQCPKCSYSNRLRVNILRHIKVHPELAPSRDVPRVEHSPSKMTARKSTSKVSAVSDEKKLKNPFSAVKDAVRELDRTERKSSETIEQLSLGGDFLHRKLSTCFIPLEKEFKCRICQQKIAKKFVLHKHILNHLHVVFFKCHYCHKGDIEQSLLSGHIQQDHSLKPIKFDCLDLNEVCNNIKDKISQQKLNDVPALDNLEITDNSQTVEAVKEDDVKDQDEQEQSVFKCSKCDYFTAKEYLLRKHRKTHMNPSEKKYGCSVCQYRALLKSHIVKHMKSVHPKEPMKYTVTSESSDKGLETVTVTDNQDAFNSTSSEAPDKSQGNAIKSSETVIVPENVIISEAGVFEMKSIYKCKECGEKKSSKWAMYHHFKTSKCHKQWYQCEACAFTNQYKKSIVQHAKIRHPGRKVGIKELPLSGKIRHIKIPIRQDEQILKNLQPSGNESHPSPESERNQPQQKSSDIIGSEVQRCKICHNYRSESLSKLQFHMNTKHQGKPLFCSECDYKTPLVKHMINHCSTVHSQEKAKYSLSEKHLKASDISEQKDSHNDSKLNQTKQLKVTKQSGSINVNIKKFKCPNCEISKDTIKTLRDHMQIHFDYKPYACHYCSAKVQHFSNVRRHVNEIHAGKTVKYSMVKDEKIENKLDQMVEQVLKQREEEKSKIVERTVKMIKKAVKRQLDSDEDALPRKKKQKLEIETDEETSQDESDRNDPSPVKYRVVKEPGTSSKMFQCVECDYITEKKEGLRGHLKKHGSKYKDYKCPYCDYSASCSTNGYRHIKNRHKGKPLKLLNAKGRELMSSKRQKVANDHSSSESSSDESFASAKSSVKMVTLKYFCSICDFVGTGLYYFRQHLAKHKEFTCLQKGSDLESRLSCGYCSYMAVDDLDFSNHISDHLDERPYHCGHCDYSSYVKKNIQSHLAAVHPEKEEIILDKRQATGEKPKMPQTMLVNFDPQITLERIDSVSANKLNRNSESKDQKIVMVSVEEKSQKLKSLSFNIPSPSKSERSEAVETMSLKVSPKETLNIEIQNLIESEESSKSELNALEVLEETDRELVSNSNMMKSSHLHMEQVKEANALPQDGESVNLAKKQMTSKSLIEQNLKELEVEQTDPDSDVSKNGATETTAITESGSHDESHFNTEKEQSTDILFNADVLGLSQNKDAVSPEKESEPLFKTSPDTVKTRLGFQKDISGNIIPEGESEDSKMVSSDKECSSNQQIDLVVQESISENMSEKAREGTTNDTEQMEIETVQKKESEHVMEEHLGIVFQLENSNTDSEGPINNQSKLEVEEERINERNNSIQNGSTDTVETENIETSLVENLVEDQTQSFEVLWESQPFDESVGVNSGIDMETQNFELISESQSFDYNIENDEQECEHGGHINSEGQDETVISSLQPTL